MAAGFIALLLICIGSTLIARQPVGRFVSAVVLHEFGVDAPAESLMRDLIAEQPGERFAPYAMLSSALMAQGETAESLDVLEEAVGFFPSDSRAQSKYCDYGVRLGQFERVAAACDQAHELSPGEAMPLINRATVRLRTGHTDGAIEDLERALDVCKQSASPSGARCQEWREWLEAVRRGEDPLPTPMSKNGE